MKNYNDYIIKHNNLIIDDNLIYTNFIDQLMINKLDSDQYIKILSFITRTKLFDYNINIDKLYSKISINIMEEYGCLLFDTDNNVICLIHDPVKYYHYDCLFSIIDKEIKVYLISDNEWYKYKEIARLNIEEKHYENFEINQNNVLKETNVFVYDEIKSAPVVMMVNHWIEKAIVLGASDIHFEPGKTQGKIRIRLDGKLNVIDNINMNNYEEVVTRIKVISNLDITKKMNPQDGKYIMKFNNLDYDIRISTIPTILGEKIVMRILNKNTVNTDFKLLNYLPEEEELIKDILKEKSGIILITGPTGSGKTTTLYTYLNELISEENNIITVEDPVEYSIEGINQIQVNNLSGLTFSNTLKGILRQDPNVIMIGEIRDEETAQIACRAAISGHLVLSTLHTNSSIDAITRLLDMGIPRYLLSSALRAVISQRLVRKLCPKCKKKIIPNLDMIKKFSLTPGVMIYEKGGCENCYNTGFKGRILLSEILIVDDNLRELISNSSTTRKIENYAKKNNMIFLDEKWKAVVMSGNTTKDEKMH